MDTDPDKVIGNEEWRAKITRQLHWANVFVSIMTANYLAPAPNGTGCQWELGVYRDLALSGDDQPHSIITLRLCDDFVSEPVLGTDPWNYLKSQEIIDYERCGKAWDQGPGKPAWDELISYVADVIIQFCRKRPAQSGPIVLQSAPMVGTPVTWKTQEKLDPKTVCHTRWLVDGKPVLDDSAVYTPTPADAGMELSVEATFECVGSHTVTRRTAPAVVRPGVIGIAGVRLTGGHSPGCSLHVTVEGVKPTHVALAYQWERDGVPIEHAGGSTYVVEEADRGRTLRVRVMASASGYGETAVTSEAVSVLDPPRDAAVDRTVGQRAIVEDATRGWPKPLFRRAPSAGQRATRQGPSVSEPWIDVVAILASAMTYYWWIHAMSSVRTNLWWLIACVLFGTAAIACWLLAYVFLDGTNPFASRHMSWWPMTLAGGAGLASGLFAVLYGGMPYKVSWLDPARFAPWGQFTFGRSPIIAWVCFVICLCSLLYAFILVWVAIYRTAARRKREPDILHLLIERTKRL
jgi:hypothetical protein